MADNGEELQFILEQARLCFDLARESDDPEIIAALRKLAGAFASRAVSSRARERALTENVCDGVG
jgi:hypothetical protein